MTYQFFDAYLFWLNVDGLSYPPFFSRWVFGEHFWDRWGSKDFYIEKWEKEIKQKGVRPSGFAWRYITTLVFERDKGICQKCGALCSNGGHIHHIIPVSNGGDSQLSNLTLYCELCHKPFHKKKNIAAHHPDQMTFPS